MAAPPVLLWEDEVKSLLRCRDLLPRLEDALGKFSRGDPADVVQPVRSVLPLHKHSGWVRPAGGPTVARRVALQEGEVAPW